MTKVSMRLGIALLWMSAGCSVAPPKKTDEIVEVKQVESVSAEVNAAKGGDITTTTGMRITFPPGALAGNETITVEVTEQKVPGFDVASLVYTFGPEGLVFAEPVAISIPTTAGSGAVVFWSTSADPTKFEPVPTEDGKGVKIGFVRHFSKGFVGTDNSPACAAVTCDAPPDDSCAGNVLQKHTSACVQGTCIYSTDSVDCPANAAEGGGGCVSGACVINCSNARVNNKRVSDCDQSTITGCEASLDDDPINCGGCGITCAANETCSDGFCLEPGLCRVAFGCVGDCVQSGTAVAQCFDTCGANLISAESVNFEATRACLTAACPDLSEACGSQAVNTTCKTQADACKGPDPDACSTTADCSKFGATSVCQEQHCTRDQGNPGNTGDTGCMPACDNDHFCNNGSCQPNGVPCTEQTLATDCANFGPGATCPNGFCAPGSSGVPCTEQTVTTDCANFGPGATCAGGFCAGGMSGGCMIDQDCELLQPGLICVMGSCQMPPPQACANDNDCSGNLICSKQVCLESTDCANQGGTCVGGVAGTTGQCSSNTIECNSWETCPAGDTCSAQQSTTGLCSTGYCMPNTRECIEDADCIGHASGVSGMVCSSYGNCVVPPCADDNSCGAHGGSLSTFVCRKERDCFLDEHCNGAYGLPGATGTCEGEVLPSATCTISGDDCSQAPCAQQTCNSVVFGTCNNAGMAECTTSVDCGGDDCLGSPSAGSCSADQSSCFFDSDCDSPICNTVPPQRGVCSTGECAEPACAQASDCVALHGAGATCENPKCSNDHYCKAVTHDLSATCVGAVEGQPDTCSITHESCVGSCSPASQTCNGGSAEVAGHCSLSTAESCSGTGQSSCPPSETCEGWQAEVFGECSIDSSACGVAMECAPLPQECSGAVAGQEGDCTLGQCMNPPPTLCENDTVCGGGTCFKNGCSDPSNCPMGSDCLSNTCTIGTCGP